jgi:hypothetical protein
MRSLFVLILLIGATQGFLFDSISEILDHVGDKLEELGNHIGQTATNLWNGVTGGVNNVVGNVVDSAGNIYGQIISTVNGLVFASNFLWDNVFGPAYDLLIEGGTLFLDDKFGNLVSPIGNIMGRRSVQPNLLSEKYTELTARLKANIHHLYEQLFEMEKQALLELQKGENALEGMIRAFHDKIAAIHEQINAWADDLKKDLEIHALTVEGDWANIIKQYSSNIDFSVKTMATMFQQLIHDLMKNLVEVALKTIPNAYIIVQNLKQEGLLSFIQ